MDCKISGENVSECPAEPTIRYNITVKTSYSSLLPFGLPCPSFLPLSHS